MAFLSLMLFSFSALAISPEDIIKKADEIRNPSEAYMMQVSLKGTDENEDSAFEVYLKGNDKTLVKTTAPKRDVGRNMLMLEENMWLYVPNLKRSVRISLSQKLSGQAANGDISRMRWHGDYAVKLISETKKIWKLHLTALKKGLTYEQIDVEIEKGNFRPITASYLSLNGMPLKYVAFAGYKKMEGKDRPGQLIITDATNKAKVTTLNIDSMKKMNLPDSLFNKNNFK